MLLSMGDVAVYGNVAVYADVAVYGKCHCLGRMSLTMVNFADS